MIMKRIKQENINTEAHWSGVYCPDFSFDGEATYRHIAQHVEELPGVLVDIGCGNGEGIRVISETRPRLKFIGVDFSQEGIDRANKELPHLGLFIQREANDTGIRDGIADTVVSSETLEHVENPESVVKEAFRILRDGGLCLVTTPWRNNIPSDEHIWSFEYEDIRGFFERAGFSEIHVFPYSSGRCVISRQGGIILPLGNRDTIMVYAIK